ncbi:MULTISPECIES: hypothetical protein [unclassified Leucobacter]|uniref:hypothetical protein n=1 Tax=unclassified Leucobacter TaxID=2621730 RepID=UPI00165D41D3|nr:MULTISPECIES: hypothetical protein [unclassified Leucobacter]MBC9926007.1 hypothetical protein [Leucobacter sp. cx-169]
MGFLEDAKEAADSAAKKISRSVEDGVDRAKDKIDELHAEADLKKAEAERDSVRLKNELKEDLRDK